MTRLTTCARGAEHIQPIERQTITASGGDPVTQRKPLAFRCARGHVFTLSLGDMEIKEGEEKTR